MNSPSPTNTSKMCLHVEQLSLKINWRLAERLLYNQGCTGRSTWGWVGGEKKRSGWNLHPEGGTQRRGYHRLRDPPCGVSASSHILATPQPWAQTPTRQVHLPGLKNSETNRRTIRNLDCTWEEHPHTCLLMKRGRLKLHETLAGYPELPQDMP